MATDDQIAQAKEQMRMHDVFVRNKYNLIQATKQSRSWFIQQALILGKQGYTPRRLMNGTTGGKMVKKIIPGKMYMYIYDAKHKDTLPYWDKFPLVFPYKLVDGGFLGLNMHYIPYEYRIKILDRLMAIEGSRNTKRVKLQLSWELISGASSLKPLLPCVHHYLWEQVRTEFREVERKDWATAMLLPVERFVTQNTPYSKNAVWKESKKIGKY